MKTTRSTRKEVGFGSKLYMTTAVRKKANISNEVYKNLQTKFEKHTKLGNNHPLDEATFDVRKDPFGGRAIIENKNYLKEVKTGISAGKDNFYKTINDNPNTDYVDLPKHKANTNIILDKLIKSYEELEDILKKPLQTTPFMMKKN